MGSSPKTISTDARRILRMNADVQIWVQEITRRNPFRIQSVPLLARIYAYPFERWESLGRQALFGAPFFLTFLFFQKFLRVNNQGTFLFRDKQIRYNGFNTQFSALYLKRFAHGYEPQITALFDLIAPDDCVFYDIGSNWGWFSLFLASKPAFRGKVHAFEPFPSSYADLRSVVEQAGLSNVIQCHNMALSDRAATINMRLPDGFQSGQAVMEESAPSSGVKSAPLDSLSLEPPWIVKMDVEGAEMKVLNGARDTFSRHKPLIIFENSRKPDDPMATLRPINFLRSLGYDFFQVGWLRGNENQQFLVGDDADPDPQPNETLALVRFDAEERFLRPDGMNIFACHRDKLDVVAQKFRRL